MFAAGCKSVPVYNVTDAPVAASKPNPGLDEIGKAIQRAGAQLGWQMKEMKPGYIVGTLNVRNQLAAVDVNYSTRSYSITYKDSAELQYDGKAIHRNYNGWIQSLDKGIRAQLSGL
jgi:hypothetical protein